MNENLNLADILRDCPKGTKLYSTIHGEVEFVEIRNTHITNHPIIYKYENNDGDYYMNSITIDGKFDFSCDGECTLFPSKDQRDWSKFKVEPEMVDGEFYYCSYGNNQKENSFIFIYEKHPLYKTKCYVALGMFGSVLFKDDLIASNNNITELRKATVEEKQQLLDAIKVRNYEWDADKKVLIKITPKFNISSFQHFDKVLVRDCNTHKWKCDFYDSYMKGNPFPFITTVTCYKQCIPYNTQTKDLAGTNKMPPKEYVNWEE